MSAVLDFVIEDEVKDAPEEVTDTTLESDAPADDQKEEGEEETKLEDGDSEDEEDKEEGAE